MSILKNILSPFIEFKKTDGTEEVEQPGDKKTTTPTATTHAGRVDDNITSTGSASVSTGADYDEYFDKLIEDANNKNPNFQGTDFKEFIDSKTDVEAIADEATRYKTAFNVLKRTGLTKERLVTTGKQYLDIVDTDLKGFETAYASQYKTDVEQKEQLLQKKAEELQALNEKIAALNAEIKQMSQQIVQSKDKLNNNKERFIAAGQNKKKEIQTELQKIDQYF